MNSGTIWGRFVEKTRGQKSRATVPLRVLKVGILKIWKKWQNPIDLRILVLFSDLKNSTFKYPYRPCKVPPLFPPRYPQTVDLHRNGWKNWKILNTLHGLKRYLQGEFWKSENCARIPRYSGFWHFFQMWKIPLVSTSKGHEKCRRFCCLGAHNNPHS